MRLCSKNLFNSLFKSSRLKELSLTAEREKMVRQSREDLFKTRME